MLTAAPAVAEALVAGRGPDWADPVLASDVADLCDLAIRLLPYQEGEIDAGPLFRRAERGARLLLSRHRDRVERVAELLLRDRTLEGGALRAALAGLGERIGVRQRWADPVPEPAPPAVDEEPPYSPWVCQTCRLPIGPGEGVIEIVNRDPKVGVVGERPVRGSDPPPKPPRPSEPFATIAAEFELLSQPFEPRRVGIDVFHLGDCDPSPETEGYWFTTDRAGTLEAWCRWVSHLRTKRWMSKDDLLDMLEYWWENQELLRADAGPRWR